jgi:branched-chain amino acid transport system permease protein
MTPGQTRLVIAAAVVLAALMPFVLPPFQVTLLNYIGIHAFAALGLVLLTGIGGLVSFGQASFMGIAAYATAWATTAMGASPWLGLALALATTGAVALGAGALTLRLSGHFLSLSTIAWGMALYFTFGNLESLGQNNGIPDVPPISIGSLALTDGRAFYWLVWGLLLAALFAMHNLLNSRVGRAMKALRGGDVLVESFGINAFGIKLAAFVIAAVLAAIAGWLFAHMDHFVSPKRFDMTASIEFLMMAMVGGAGHLLGAVLGSALITLMKNYIQDVLPLVKNSIQDVLPQIASGVTGQLEIVVFSVLFIVFLQHARDGIVPFAARFLPAPVRSRPAPAKPLPRREKPPPGGVLMKVDGVQRRFGGLLAVDNVSFDVRAGEILGLIGPNGAGKTTMFNLITGALPVSGGRIVFAGQDMTRAPQRRIARAGIARTFQHVKLRPRLTLLDNVLLGAHVRTRAGILSATLRLDRGEERRAQFEALCQLERAGLGDRCFELAGNLPLGHQRLLEIARALAADPVLLVLDEPAAGLRRQEKLALADLLRTLKAEGLTILLVEHDMDFVMRLVDRIVVMDFGCKLCEGDPRAVRSDPRVQEAYLGGVA